MGVGVQNQPKFTLREQIIEQLNKFGLFVIFFAVFTIYNTIVFGVMMLYIQRAESNLDLSNKVGQLEGKLEILISSQSARQDTSR